MKSLNIEHGPLLEEPMLSAGLDYYKPTMSQVQYEKNRDAEVTFSLKNRGENLLTDYIHPEELQARLDSFSAGWSSREIEFLASHERRGGEPLFSGGFLEYLRTNELPPVQVGTDQETGELSVTTTGEWPLVTFWETVVMSEANQMYFENLITVQGLDIADIYDEGDRRLSEKIEILRSRPDIKFADFGTRRRFSLRWHNHVVQRLIQECPENLIGTSNVALAEKYDLMPIGTFAHEMPMVYAALSQTKGESPLLGHRQMLQDWEEIYDDNLSTALTDTFGSEYFFSDFTPEQAKTWKGLRHDSGDPFEFGKKVIEFYENLGINPKDKTLVFSDGLDIDSIVNLADHFGDSINVVFGWGTSLTNDVGLDTNSIVMKAVKANGQGTVKTSDNPSKYTGYEEDVRILQEEVESHLAHVALQGAAA